MSSLAASRTPAEALRESKEKYRTLVDEAAEILVVHDLSGRICEVNRAAVEATGYTRDELLSRFVWDLDPDASARRDQEIFWQGLPPGSRAVIETRHRRKDGSEYPAEVRIAKVEFGGQAYILALTSDLSKRREAEQKAEAAQQRLNILLANLPGMAYRCANDSNWTMDFVSEGALDLTGYAPPAFYGAQGVSYASLIHPGDRRRVWTAIQEAWQQDASFTLEYRIRDAQGVEKWVLEKGRCVDDDTIEGFITDITERKRYEETLTEKTVLENQLLQLQKADSINRLTGAVAHHFNNKLHGVMASLELLKIQTSDRQGDEQEMIDTAMGVAQQAAEISRLLLMTLGQLPLKRQRLDLVALCRERQHALASAMPKTVRLDIELPMTALKVYADAEAIYRIMNNLITNAWEADGCGHVGLRVFCGQLTTLGEGIRHPVEWNPQAGPFAVIEISDDGAGISETLGEQIFDPFFSTKWVGRGIGLALVLGLVRSHGGGVIVQSQPGKGSVFRVCIPIEMIGREALESGGETSTRAENSIQVLLVEDEAPLRELAAMMLRSLGCRVLEAADGREAMALVKAHRAEIGAVLSDIRMPKLDGWRLLNELRHTAPGLPVIFVTAYNDATKPPDGQQEQPDALIRKPYLIKDLKKVLDQIARQSIK